MRYKFREIPRLLASSRGRRSLFMGQVSRFYPLFRFLARMYRRKILKKTCVVTVIGSLGKTTTVKMAASVVGDQRPGDMRNADYAVIQNLLKYSRKDTHAVLEVGIEKPGQMRPHALMIRPDIVIVTSIASEHVLSFKTLEGIREEKADMVRILPGNGTAILNADDPHVMWMASQTKATVVTYGTSDEADVRATNIKTDFPHGMTFDISVGGRIYDCRTRLPGRHMVYPALAAVALAWFRGMDIAAACEKISEVEPENSRMQQVRLASGAIIIRDDFKSTRESIWAALDTLAKCPAKRKILILGAASEITNDIRYSFHKELGRRIAESADLVYVLNRKEIFRSIRQGACGAGMDESRLARVEGNPLSVIPLLPTDLGEGDIVLIKGRTNQRLARIALALAGKDVGCRIPYCNTREYFCDECQWLGTGPGT